jgi:hypothetical protein
MAIDKQDLKKVLVAKKIVAAKAWDDLAKEADEKNEQILDLLVDKKLIEAEKLAQLIAAFYDVEYANLQDLGHPERYIASCARTYSASL